MKSKQQIYAEILQQGIVRIRNGDENTALHLLTCYTVADLLHNIPLYMLHEGFDETDFYFINIEVRSYIKYCEHLHISPDATLLSLADELRGIVPKDLKSNLTRL